MRKSLYFILCVMIFLINIDIVKAASCDDEDMARLKGLAGGVSYNAEYIGDTGEAKTSQDYKVNFIGLTDEIYVSDSHYTFQVESDREIIDMVSGSYDYQIYSKNCNDLRLKTITIDLPKFNLFSESFECRLKAHKNLDVCDPWYSGNITDDQFYKIIDNYDKKIKKDDEISLIDKIKEFYWNNTLIFWAVIIVISIIFVIVGFINHLKNKLD